MRVPPRRFQEVHVGELSDHLNTETVATGLLGVALLGAYIFFDAKEKRADAARQAKYDRDQRRR